MIASFQWNPAGMSDRIVGHGDGAALDRTFFVASEERMDRHERAAARVFGTS